ncbi:hypothetical protein AXG93_2960s1130 [Marchantia polymorpha subsp. ruderalis]|uniref:Expansin n=1 Tax=Marchantia polymorpha subsp. ruderalis TaxID=1480154 RepID=A0A176WA02_MARPO|nr:hypothetical protein AXG93_2960s1130 [Marchantia polymorpha subsp. ruderalis]
MATMPRLTLVQALSLTTALLLRLTPATASPPAWEVTAWTPSHATFYGEYNGVETMGGACGYGNLWWRGYGLETAALSDTLLNNGLTCGACFQLKCDLDHGGYSTRWCYKNVAPITVTATNHCPANWARPTNNGGWCNPPRTHFDLPLVMFNRMAQPVAGIIPIEYRRVPCEKSGGLKFYLSGNPWFNLVLVYNVAGAGAVTSMKMRGSQTVWYSMKRNWGQYWECPIKFSNQRLSFQVTLSSGHVRVINNLTPTNWYFGQTYEAATNF